MPLHGNDIDETTTVVEADLNWIVGWSKPAFLGRDVLHAQKTGGTTRTLVGFEMTERAIGRHGHAVFHNGQPVGIVTSGTQTPFLKKAIGMAYVPPALKAPGTEIEIDIRGRRAKAVVVSMPFYKRPKKS
jgi:aminomethyltransferase